MLNVNICVVYSNSLSHARIQRGDRGSGSPWKITIYMGFNRNYHLVIFEFGDILKTYDLKILKMKESENITNLL